MKVIRDIRLFASDIPNEDGGSWPDPLSSKKLNVTVHRIAMKLHEKQFSLGDFDHLYLNFSSCLAPGTSYPAKRSVEPYHPWYRFYDIGISASEREHLAEDGLLESILDIVYEVLLRHFATDECARPAKIGLLMTLIKQLGHRGSLTETRNRWSPGRKYLKCRNDGATSASLPSVWL